MKRMTGRVASLATFGLCGLVVLVAPGEAGAAPVFLVNCAGRLVDNTPVVREARGPNPVSCEVIGGNLLHPLVVTETNAAALPGILQSSSQARTSAINEFGLSPGFFITSSLAMFVLDDVIISAPPGMGGPVSGELRLELSGTLSLEHVGDGAEGFVKVRILGVGEGLASISTRLGFGVSGVIRDAGVASPEDLQQHVLLTIPLADLPVGVAFPLVLSLGTSAELAYLGSDLGTPISFSVDGVADFRHTLSFPTTGPVITLPPGYTVNSASGRIADNHWAGPANGSPPTANAGTDQTRIEGTLVTLDGTASTDPDGDTLGYSWAQLDGPAVALSNPISSTPTFTAPLVDSGGAALLFELTVNDGSGASSTDEVAVLVQNANDPPACTAAQPSRTWLWPPDHDWAPIGITGISDPDNNPVTVVVTGITQDEPVNGPGDGNTGPDAVIQTHGVLLRAERAGGGNGRVYRVQFTADDSQGGVCSGAVTVGVPRNMSPGSSTVDDGQLFDSTHP